MRTEAALLLLLLSQTGWADLEALPNDDMGNVAGQAGITLSNVDWTLNYDKSTSSRRGCLDSPTNQLCNSIPLQLDGSSRYLVLYNNVGLVHANKIDIDLVKTPTSIYDSDGNSTNDAQVPAIRVSFPDPTTDLEFKNWRIDKISVASTDTLSSAAMNENGKIIHFETNAKWSFGPNTAAYFFKTP